MSSKSIDKGFLISSTPVQSSEEDSGYFGSSERRNFYGSNANLLNTFSPIKELCFKDLSESFSWEHDNNKISLQPKINKNILDADFTNNVYESSSLEIDELSEVEFVSDSVSKDKIHWSSEQQYLNVPSLSESTESQNFALSSKIKDIKYELFENKPGNLRPGNFNGFKNLKHELSHTHLKHELENLTVCKQTKINFIHDLNKINCLSLISGILSYLSAKELCIASCVNKEWNQIIQSDCNANFRRKNFIKERDLFFNGPSKENRLGRRSGPARELKKAFFDITNRNTNEHPLVSKDSNTRFDSFLKERGNGHLKLRKCPKCCYASKSMNGNNYKCTHCSYIFCSNCIGPAFINHTCNKSLLPNIIVGSKKSKKNLKRL